MDFLSGSMFYALGGYVIFMEGDGLLMAGDVCSMGVPCNFHRGGWNFGRWRFVFHGG